MARMKEAIKAYVEKWHESKTAREIAEQLRCSIRLVYESMNELGITPRTEGDDNVEFVRNYASTQSLEWMAQKMRVGIEAARKICNKAGVEYRREKEIKSAVPLLVIPKPIVLPCAPPISSIPEPPINTPPPTRYSTKTLSLLAECGFIGNATLKKYSKVISEKEELPDYEGE